MGAEEVLRSAHRPLTSDEVVRRVKDKNRNSVYKELRTLQKHKLVLKLEVRLPKGNFGVSSPVILYNWIG